jgi:hypothetical protein
VALVVINAASAAETGRDLTANVNRMRLSVVASVNTGWSGKMKEAIDNTWKAVMDNRHNPLRHLDLASQHSLMQVLGWMWSMVFSISFLSIYQFGYVWMAHLLVFGGAAMTVAVFRNAERMEEERLQPSRELSSASRCVWQLDREA